MTPRPPADDDFAVLLQRLRTVILDAGDPDTGITAIQPFLLEEADPTRRCDLLILAAEAHQRHGRYYDARQRLAQATVLARSHDLAEPAMIAAGVAVDLAICERAPDLVSTCTTHLTATRLPIGNEPVEHTTQRYLLAAVQHAITTYLFHSCRDGVARLTSLRPNPTSESGFLTTVKTTYEPMVTATITAMNDGCRPYCLPPSATALPPFPGGLLQPHREPALDFGARRVDQPTGSGPQTVRHTCAIAREENTQP